MQFATPPKSPLVTDCSFWVAFRTWELRLVLLTSLPDKKNLDFHCSRVRCPRKVVSTKATDGPLRCRPGVSCSVSGSPGSSSLHPSSCYLWPWSSRTRYSCPSFCYLWPWSSQTRYGCPSSCFLWPWSSRTRYGCPSFCYLWPWSSRTRYGCPSSCYLWPWSSRTRYGYKKMLIHTALDATREAKQTGTRESHCSNGTVSTARNKAMHQAVSVRMGPLAPFVRVARPVWIAPNQKHFPCCIFVSPATFHHRNAGCEKDPLKTTKRCRYFPVKEYG